MRYGSKPCLFEVKFYDSIIESQQWMMVKERGSNRFKTVMESHQKCHHMMLVLISFKFGSVSGAQTKRFRKDQLIPYCLHFRQKFIDGLIGLLPFGMGGSQKLILVGKVFGGVPRLEKVLNFLSIGKSSKLLIDRENWSIVTPGNYIIVLCYPIIISVTKIFI